MQITSPTFKANARTALADAQLQKALGNVRGGFIDKRAKAVSELPEFDQLRDNGREIKNHVLDNLDLYLKPTKRRCSRPAARCTGARPRRMRAAQFSISAG
jgi:L-lactate dehydrogenase complex protein LldF